MTTKLRSTVSAVVSVDVAAGQWNGRNVNDVALVSPLVYRVTLADIITMGGAIATVGVDAYELVAPGVIELTLTQSRNWSLFVVDTGPGAPVPVSGGGGPSPPVWQGFIDLGDVSGPVELDGSIAMAWKMTLVGDVDLTFVNLTKGVEYDVQAVEDSTGGWIINYPGGTEFDDNAPGEPSPAALESTLIHFFARTTTAVTVAAFGGGPVTPLGFVTVAGATGATAIDPSAANSFRIAAVGDVVLTPSAPFVVGVDYSIYFVQDIIGNHGLAFDGSITVDVPEYVDGIKPNSDPTFSSTFIFRATGPTSLELVGSLAAENFAIVASQVLSRIGESLLIQGGAKSFADFYHFKSSTVFLGAPDNADGRRTAAFLIYCSDEDLPAAVTYDLFRFYAVGSGAGVNPPVQEYFELLLLDARVTFPDTGTVRVQAVPSATDILVWDATGIDITGSRLKYASITTTNAQAQADRTTVARGFSGVVNLPPVNIQTQRQTLTIKVLAGDVQEIRPDGTDRIDGVAGAPSYVTITGPASVSFSSILAAESTTVLGVNANGWIAYGV